MKKNDVKWMKKALQLAKQASQEGEVPIGAIMIKDQEIISQGFNQSIKTNDPSAHAECVAIRQAAQKLQNYRLPDTMLYTTLEPCLMCTGLILHARIKRVIFSCRDPKAGAICSCVNGLKFKFVNHITEVEEGLLCDESSNLLRSFFAARR